MYIKYIPNSTELGGTVDYIDYMCDCANRYTREGVVFRQLSNPFTYKILDISKK